MNEESKKLLSVQKLNTLPSALRVSQISLTSSIVKSGRPISGLILLQAWVASSFHTLTVLSTLMQASMLLFSIVISLREQLFPRTELLSEIGEWEHALNKTCLLKSAYLGLLGQEFQLSFENSKQFPWKQCLWAFLPWGQSFWKFCNSELHLLDM